MGTTCMATIGGSSGPVFGTLLVTLAKELPARADAGRPCRARSPPAIAALTRLGKAEVGQKTLLDVLDPVQQRARRRAAGDADLAARVRQCALDSAAATATMDGDQAAAPRSSASARSATSIPGSRSMALIIGAICDSL